MNCSVHVLILAVFFFVHTTNALLAKRSFANRISHPLKLVISVEDGQFESEVLKSSETVPVVVDFFANWYSTRTPSYQ